MSRKFWLGTGLIFSIVLVGLLSMDAKQHPVRAETLQVVMPPCQDFSSIGTYTQIWIDNPDPSKAGQPFSVAWFVRNKNSSFPIGPRGYVTISGGGSSCSGSTSGMCQLTISTRGSYVITAKFVGGYYNFCRWTNSSDTEPHTVIR